METIINSILTKDHLKGCHDDGQDGERKYYCQDKTKLIDHFKSNKNTRIKIWKTCWDQISVYALSGLTLGRLWIGMHKPIWSEANDYVLLDLTHGGLWTDMHSLI